MMNPSQEPLLTVITVCFNSEKTIATTIESVLKQSFTDFEYLIIDGKSKDQTEEVVRQYQNDPRIHFHSEKDKGIYDAMNKGIQTARGKFLHFLNADDYLTTENIYKIFADHFGNEETIFHGKIKYVHQDGKTRIIGHPLKNGDLSFGLKGIHQPATFFPRKAFESYGNFSLNYKVSSDYELIRRLTSHLHTRFVDEVCVVMADGGASATQISTACREDRQISILYGEKKSKVFLHEFKTRFGLMLRQRWPWLFHRLLDIKRFLFKRHHVSEKS